MRREHAREVADIFCRRVPIYRDARDQGLDAAERAATILGAALGWNPARQARSVADYQSVVASSRRWRAELTAP